MTDESAFLRVLVAYSAKFECRIIALERVDAHNIPSACM
jgi:hypothetical protein